MVEPRHGLWSSTTDPWSAAVEDVEAQPVNSDELRFTRHERHAIRTNVKHALGNALGETGMISTSMRLAHR